MKATEKLQVKRVYDRPSETDGTRVLVDHIWPRGLTKEKAALSLWLKEIAPSAELREWFGHDPARWVEFEQRYRLELQRNEAAVSRLLELLDGHVVTLLYAAHDISHNNAVALMNYMAARRGADRP